MQILPIIDLLIFLGWTTLSVGAVLKGIHMTTSFRPTILGFGPLDLLIVAGVFLVLAVALAARTWVKINEPQLTATRRAASTLEAYRALHENGDVGTPLNAAREPVAPAAEALQRQRSTS